MVFVVSFIWYYLRSLYIEGNTCLHPPCGWSTTISEMSCIRLDINLRIILIKLDYVCAFVCPRRRLFCMITRRQRWQFRRSLSWRDILLGGMCNGLIWNREGGRVTYFWFGYKDLFAVWKLLFEEKVELGRKVLESIRPPRVNFGCSLKNSYLRRKQSWGGKSLSG